MREEKGYFPVARLLAHHEHSGAGSFSEDRPQPFDDTPGEITCQADTHRQVIACRIGMKGKSQMSDDLKIIRLEAENIKRLKVVEITPDGNLVEITGNNGHGKTSVLDSILWALGGKGAVQKQPVRLGSKKGHVTLDLGDDRGLRFRVTRRFRADPDGGDATTALIIEAPDGSKPQAPQTLLDAIVGTIAFDPLEFERTDGKGRLAILKGLIPGIDFDKLAKDRQAFYFARRDVNRDAERLKAQAAIPLPEDCPLESIDTRAIEGELRAAERQIGAINEERIRRQAHSHDKAALFKRADDFQKRANELRRQADEAEAAAKADHEDAEAMTAAALEWKALPPEPDTDAILSRLAGANENNRLFSKRQEVQQLLLQFDEAETESNRLSNEIERIDTTVRAAIEKADLPVTGLELGEADVMLKGVPFEQGSDAERLRASMAIGMALNPKLRVMRVRDGSILDGPAMALLAEVAAEENFQIWIERVIASGPSAIIMEDGMVKGAAP